MKTELKSKEEILSEQFPLLPKSSDKAGIDRILEAMQLYSDQNCEHTQDMFTAPNYILNPLEDLYRKEHPRPDGKFYIPDRTEFYKWIVEKIMGKETDINNPEDCQHEYRSFVDRHDKSREIWCYKCGKHYDGHYNHKF